jgi:hypothetical protein
LTCLPPQLKHLSMKKLEQLMDLYYRAMFDVQSIEWTIVGIILDLRDKRGLISSWDEYRKEQEEFQEKSHFGKLIGDLMHEKKEGTSVPIDIDDLVEKIKTEIKDRRNHLAHKFAFHHHPDLIQDEQWHKSMGAGIEYLEKTLQVFWDFDMYLHGVGNKLGPGFFAREVGAALEKQIERDKADRS